MKIKITLKFVIAFLALSFVMLELHEIVHTSVGRIICGGWGERDFNAWDLYKGCDSNPIAWLSTFAGPFFTFLMCWYGAILLKSTNSTEQKSFGFALIFANSPFARILNTILRCGDEQNLVYKLVPDINTSSIITFFIIVGILFYPLMTAYKTILNKRIGYFLLFFIVPTVMMILVVLVLLNTLLAEGLLAETGLLGSPIIVNVWTAFVLLVFLIFRKSIYTLFEKQ